MSARTPQSCEGVTGEHHGPVRPYSCGPRCDAHSPWAAKGLPELTPQPPKAPPAAVITHPAAAVRPRDVIFVDLGEGYEIKKDGPRKGQIWWKRDPRARFECLVCEWPSAVVTGADEVRAFVAEIRVRHRSECPGYPVQHQQQAA